jgi:hypothetical protein
MHIINARPTVGLGARPHASERQKGKLPPHSRHPNARRNRGFCAEARPMHRRQTANTSLPASAPHLQHGTALRFHHPLAARARIFTAFRARPQQP